MVISPFINPYIYAKLFFSEVNLLFSASVPVKLTYIIVSI